jgi:hypothetical protein
VGQMRKCGSSIISIFEVTTYKELRASLSDIMQTWRFI